MENSTETIRYSLMFRGKNETRFCVATEKNGELEEGKFARLPLMEITSSLIEEFFPLINNFELSSENQAEIKNIFITNFILALRNVEIKVINTYIKDPNLIKTLPQIGNWEPESKLKNQDWSKVDVREINDVLDEINLLRYAVNDWLDERKYPQKDDFLSTSDSQGSRAANMLQNRMIQSPATPIFFSDSPAWLHRANNFFPLAWAEIWHAMEKKVRARCCPYCGKVFLLPLNNTRKATCLSPSCKQKYEVDRHGGIEAYREWERNRKKVQSKRPPGRPKIAKPIEETPTKKKVGRPRKDGV